MIDIPIRENVDTETKQRGDSVKRHREKTAIDKLKRVLEQFRPSQNLGENNFGDTMFPDSWSPD